jgi:hypothetical protein
MYVVLRKYADYQTGETFVGRKTLAADCACSLDTVDRVLTELVQAQALKVERRPQHSNLYTVFTAPGGIAAPLRPHGGTGAARSSRTGAAQTKTNVSKPPTMVQAFAFADEWCDIAGIRPTRSVLKKLAGQIAEYMATDVVTTDFMKLAHQQGIKGPKGWPYVKLTEAYSYQEVTVDADECDHKVQDADGYCTKCKTWEAERHQA